MDLIIINGSWRFFLWGGEVDTIRECCLEEVVKGEKLANHSFVGVVLPEKGERETDMVALLKDGVFQDLMSNLKTKKSKDVESRSELIKTIGNYAKHLEKVGTECDLLERAKVEGILLESILRLLVRDQFDPIGCIILAQQDRETQVDQVSSLFEAGVE